MTTRRQTVTVFVAAGLAVLVIVAVTAIVVAAVTSTNIRSTQQDNTQTLDSSAETLQIIKDCTRPGGDCYERSRKQTADAVADLNRVSVLAAACADKRGVQGEDEIYACVIRALAEQPPTP